MPKIRHEAVVEIFQNEPKLVLLLLERAGVYLPFGKRVIARIADSNLSDRDTEEDGRVLTLISDNVFVFSGGGIKIAVVAEVQTSRPGKDRSLSWPAYLANARARHKCDALLMVFATNTKAANGSAKAIRTGHPGWNLIPLMSGVGRTPGKPPDGTRFAAELVVLRVITGEHKLSSHDGRMFALAALKGAPPSRRLRYARYIRALAPPRERQPLEDLMKTVLKDDFMDGLIEEGLAKGLAKGLEKGVAKGRAEMLLDLLETRFGVPANVRERVDACTDAAQIRTWFRRALNASSLDEVFAKLRPKPGSRSHGRRHRTPA